MKCFDNGGRSPVARPRVDLAPWAVVAASVPVHVALALVTDLSPDEAYYLCAARLGGGIVDHPPLTMWLLRLSDRWSGAPVELRVRVWAIALSLATGVAIVALARRRGAGPRGCLLAAWVGTWALLPAAGGFVTTPDGPLLLAVTLALLAGGRTAATGAALVVGALAKVAALPVAAALAAGRKGAPMATRVGLALAPLAALPWLWPSLRFQLRHAFVQTAPTGWSAAAAAGAVLAAAGAQVALWSPMVLWRGFRALPRLPSAERAVVWTFTGLVLTSALVRAVPPEPNWWAPAAIVVLIAFAADAEPLSPRARRAILASVLVPTVVASTHVARPFLPLPEHADPTARLHGWSRGHTPDAPGVGPYGAAAERCVYQNECDKISSYFNKMKLHE